MQSFKLSNSITSDHDQNENENKLDNQDKLVASKIFENIEQELSIDMVQVDKALIQALNSLNVSKFNIGYMDWSDIDQEYLKNKLNIGDWTNLQNVSLSYKSLGDDAIKQNYLNRELMNQQYLKHVTLIFYKVEKLLSSMIPDKLRSHCIEQVNLVFQGSNCGIFYPLLKLFTENNHLKLFCMELKGPQHEIAVLNDDELKMLEILLTNKNISHFGIRSPFNVTSLKRFVDYFCQLLNDEPEFGDKLNTIDPNECAISVGLEKDELDEFISIIDELIVANSMKCKFFKLIGVKRLYFDTTDADLSSSYKKSFAKSINELIKSSKSKLKHPKKCKIKCGYDKQLEEMYITI